MRKRQKFVLTSSLLAICLVAIAGFGLETRYPLIAVFGAITWLLAGWGLREGLSGIEWLMVLVPMVTLSVGVGLFYILLPASIIYRLLIVVIFAICQYILILTANIFSVAAIRTIALLRTAHVVGVVMMLLTGFLLFNTILSFRMGFGSVGIAVAMVSFVLYLPTLWSIKLEKRISGQVWQYSTIMAIMCGVLATMLSFWPMNFSVESLFLVTYLYVTVGIVQHYYQEKLFTRTVWEYVVWGGMVMVTALVKTFF